MWCLDAVPGRELIGVLIGDETMLRISCRTLRREL